MTKPCPFGNKDLSESFWCREAWPIMKSLLSDVDGLTMIDGEKAGLESGKRRNMGRKVDMELSTPRKQTGRKLDLVARDTTNKRDWFIVESNKEWDEVSTKFLREIDMTLFKDLHLIASHRLQEQSSARFRSEARFLSVYSGGKLLSTIVCVKYCSYCLFCSLLTQSYAFRQRVQNIGNESLPLQPIHHVSTRVRVVLVTLYCYNMEAAGTRTRPPIAS